MTTEVIVALIVLAGGVATAITSYLIGKRQSSGSVSTSDAASLWAESNALRQEYRNRAEILEARLEEVNRQLQDVISQLSALNSRSNKMIEKIDELKRIILKLQTENRRLLAEKRKGYK